MYHVTWVLSTFFSWVKGQAILTKFSSCLSTSTDPVLITLVRVGIGSALLRTDEVFGCQDRRRRGGEKEQGQGAQVARHLPRGGRGRGAGEEE